ncbi:sodium- and chloride-dependent neutral and basic amino acid transporter B(0+)-like protein [Leptotrombidium deliense]|uniref:Sodium-and chloride-dependent neutral and basic amino acid transporter B(0+)-like protein n=1 Tax=Leptotrombidium deliense TaxID=299467 RepID=A0A443S3G7_9ACAR|nr:sodium- and chloride-dependent neutral and basic amino acid transporter B(0+)-like protein [Leptotrombidium deliense]
MADVTLAFTVILSGLSTVPASGVWTFLFFFGLFTLGIDSQFAFVETVTTYFYDREMERGVKPNHLKVTLIYGTFLFLFSLPFATRVGIYLFDLYENYSAGLSVMFVAILECLLVSHIYGTNRLLDNLKFMSDTELGWLSRKILHVLYGFILPIMLAVLLYATLKALISDTLDGIIFNVPSPWWATAWGWSLTVVPMSCIPIGMVHFWYNSDKRTAKEKLIDGITVRPQFDAAAEAIGSYDQNREALEANAKIEII